MMTIFGEFEDWSIVIFDNLLVLANDYADAYSKLKLILNRCTERNMILKFSKTWLGFDHCEFFGYLCQHLCYELTEKWKSSIMKFEMPQSTKQMQRFLGCALFFRQFVPNFSDTTAPLHDMVKKGFNWDKSTWTVDYEMVFTNFKKALVNATKLFYPDYDLEWILRVDASDVGVGYVLFQVNIDDNNSIVHQPITFGSKKFSPAAAKWSVYDKEAYAMFFGVLDNQYYLRAKHFILEGDHRNLQWIEKSLTPRVIRWRVFLQGFSFMFRHISGALNKVADGPVTGKKDTNLVKKSLIT